MTTPNDFPTDECPTKLWEDGITGEGYHCHCKNNTHGYDSQCTAILSNLPKTGRLKAGEGTVCSFCGPQGRALPPAGTLGENR